jgi:hypothetical protein
LFGIVAVRFEMLAPFKVPMLIGLVKLPKASDICAVNTFPLLKTASLLKFTRLVTLAEGEVRKGLELAELVVMLLPLATIIVTSFDITASLY